MIDNDDGGAINISFPADEAPLRDHGDVFISFVARLGYVSVDPIFITSGKSSAAIKKC
jgi:hypothetical protein